MATTSHISTSVFGSPVAFLAGLADRFVLHMNYRKTVRILSALTRTELEDLGLHHGSVDQAAREAVYGV